MTQYSTAAPGGQGPQPPPSPAEHVVQPVIEVRIGDESTPINPLDLTDSDYADQLREMVAGAGQPVTLVIAELGAIPADARWPLFSIFAPPTNVNYTVRGISYTDLLEAALGSLVGDDDVAECEAAIRTAVDAAIAVHGRDYRSACGRIARRLRELWVGGWSVTAVLAAAKERADFLLPAGEPVAETRPVKEYLPTAPVSDDAIVPPGWSISPNGISRGSSTIVGEIAPAPVVLTARVVDANTHAEKIRLSWLRDGQWRHAVVDRACIADTRQVISLANFGVPVTSNSAKDLVEYLAAYESWNLDLLPRVEVTTTMGWQGDGGADGFVAGQLHITAHEIRDCSALDSVSPLEWPSGLIRYHGETDGEQQIARAYHQHGTLDGSLAMLDTLDGHPRPKLAVLASLAASLLPILGAPNPIMDFAGPTSLGKTTTLRVAGSIWGCPDERSPNSVIDSWASTRLHIERRAAAQDCLPLLIDETRRAKYPELVGQVLFDVAAGRGRGRGTPGGMARSGTYCTAMISTGESPATNFTGDGGTRARVIQLWGAPFGAVSAETGALVRALNQAACEHYGQIGPRLVQWLASHRDQWDEYRTDYRQRRDELVAQVPADSVAQRLCEYLATLSVTFVLTREADLLPWSDVDPVDEIWDVLVAVAPEADGAMAALVSAVEWATANRHQLFDLSPPASQPGNRAPLTGWAGRWDSHVNYRHVDHHLCFFPDRLRRILADAGHDYEAAVRTWRDRGWLHVDPSSGKARRRVRVEKQEPWLIALTPAAVNLVLNGDADPSSVTPGSGA